MRALTLTFFMLAIGAPSALAADVTIDLKRGQYLPFIAILPRVDSRSPEPATITCGIEDAELKTALRKTNPLLRAAVAMGAAVGPTDVSFIDLDVGGDVSALLMPGRDERVRIFCRE